MGFTMGSAVCQRYATGLRWKDSKTERRNQQIANRKGNDVDTNELQARETVR